MREWRVGRFWRREIEAADSPIWRTMWRRLHPECRAPEAEIHASNRGPYEASYSIEHGYGVERSIIRP